MLILVLYLTFKIWNFELLQTIWVEIKINENKSNFLEKNNTGAGRGWVWGGCEYPPAPAPH